MRKIFIYEKDSFILITLSHSSFGQLTAMETFELMKLSTLEIKSKELICA